MSEEQVISQKLSDKESLTIGPATERPDCQSVNATEKVQAAGGLQMLPMSLTSSIHYEFSYNTAMLRIDTHNSDDKLNHYYAIVCTCLCIDM